MVLGGCDMKKLIYFPGRVISITPKDVALEFDDVYFTTSDGVRINGWYVPARGAKQTLLWFHGNGGNLSDRVDQLRLIHHHLHVNVFMIDYREYGRSDGSVSEEGTYRDAQASLEYLRGRPGIEQQQLVYYGQSLGAAVAVELALQAEPRALILESPFISVQEMAKAVMPWLPIGGLISTKYESLSKIARLHMPLLILHGDRDEIVPFDQGQRLFEAANEPKSFYTIPGAHHNDTYMVGGEAYFSRIQSFLTTLQ